MRRTALIALAALALLPVASGGGVNRALPLHGPQAETSAPIGVVSDGSASRLARLDPTRLAPLQTSRVLGTIGAWVVSPDRRLLALGVGTDAQNTSETIRFVNAGSLRVVRRGVRLDGWLAGALWPTAGRLYALVGSRNTLTVETIDTVAKTVIRRQTLDGVAAQLGRFSGGLVVVLQRPNQIAPVSLVVVGADGSVRSVRLDRIQAGWEWPEGQGNDPIGTTRGPGLAVDPSGTAYVLDADGLVAAVDLPTLATAYHTLTSRSLLARLAGWLTPPALAKGINGPERSATWLGDGLIALTGADWTATRSNDGSVALSESPAGLVVVDVRDWTARALDTRATGVAVADGALLTTGGGWTSTDPGTGEGVEIYGADGTLHHRLFAGTRPYVAATVGGLAVVQEDGNGRYDVVDAATGVTVRSAVGEAPWPLVGSGS